MKVKFLLVFFLPLSLLAQQPAVVLEPGVGQAHFAVSTKNPEAQRFFDQGMAYLYGFNHEAAIRSFRRAAQLDPDLAMAHWGLALALGPNINLDVDPDRVDYSRAMGELVEQYPDDLDLATLYAESMMDLRPWKFWSHDGKPAPETEKIVKVLESVLARNPKHIGANHYYIHAVEASPHPQRALKSADRLRALAPASGHLVHMPAHIYQRTGNYSGAAKANETAAQVDRQFIKKNGGEGIYPLMYYNHNLQFGSASYAMEGRFADAKRMADEFGATATAMAREMPMLESAAAAPMLVLVRFGRWTDVLRTPEVQAGPLSTVLSHFARGVAFARLGDIAGAEREQARFEAARESLTDDLGILQNSPKKVALPRQRESG